MGVSYFALIHVPRISHVQRHGTVVAETDCCIRAMGAFALRWRKGPVATAPDIDPSTDAKDDMSKHAVKVAVRNVVRVVSVPPQALNGRGDARRPSSPAASPQSQLLSGVSWDDGRRVWLVHPAPLPARG